MSIDASFARARNAALTLKIAAAGAERARVLDFIRERFITCFDAKVDDDTPTLVGAFDSAGVLIAAFGLRDASSGFFCERYLGEAIEEALTRACRRPIQRHETIEVTHLCATRFGLLAQLLPVLPDALIANGFRTLTCTATDRLACFFERRGLRPITLAAARADALPADMRARWGRYYAANPRVLAGDLATARSRLSRATAATPPAQH
jgi:hypothetical protein